MYIVIGAHVDGSCGEIDEIIPVFYGQYPDLALAQARVRVLYMENVFGFCTSWHPIVQRIERENPNYFAECDAEATRASLKAATSYVEMGSWDSVRIVEVQ